MNETQSEKNTFPTLRASTVEVGPCGEGVATIVRRTFIIGIVAVGETVSTTGWVAAGADGVPVGVPVGVLVVVQEASVKVAVRYIITRGVGDILMADVPPMK